MDKEKLFVVFIVLFSAMSLAACGAMQSPQLESVAVASTATIGAEQSDGDVFTEVTAAAQDTSVPGSGGRIGTFVVSDSDSYYYSVQLDHLCRIDMETMNALPIRAMAGGSYCYQILTDQYDRPYYLAGSSQECEQYGNKLYRFGENGDALLLDDIFYILRFDGRKLHYLDSEGQICIYDLDAGTNMETGHTGFAMTVPYQMPDQLPYCLVNREDANGNYLPYRYYFSDGSLKQIPQIILHPNGIATDDGCYILDFDYDSQSRLTGVSLLDVETGKLVIDQFDVGKFPEGSIQSALVRDGKLYVLFVDQESSSICRIDMNTLDAATVATVDAGYFGNVQTVLYQGKYWIIYLEAVSKGTAEDPEEILPKVLVFDLKTGGMTAVDGGEAMPFNGERLARIGVINEVLFVSDYYTAGCPVTGMYDYRGYIDLGVVQ